MIEQIRNRLTQGYTTSIYGTSELLHEQMEEDIQTLLILFDALETSLKSRIEYLNNVEKETVNDIITTTVSMFELESVLENLHNSK